MNGYDRINKIKRQQARREQSERVAATISIVPPLPGTTLADPSSPNRSMNTDSSVDYLDSAKRSDFSRANIFGNSYSYFSDTSSTESIQNDTSSESFDDFNMNEDNSADSPPLFYQSSLSVREASLAILTVSRKLNLNKANIKLLLDCIHKMLPVSNKLPRTTLGLIRYARVECLQKVSYFCSQCLSPISSSTARQCSAPCPLDTRDRLPIHVAEVHWNNVSEQVKRIAERHLPLIEEYSARFNLIPADIPNSSIFQQLPRTHSPTKHLTLLLQTDGAPLIKVGSKSLWPVQATIAEIPPPIRDRNSAVMIFGSWLSSVHPNRDVLWKPIVAQIQLLHRNGIRLRRPDESFELFSVRTQFILFDLPAMALHMNIKQYNGYFACPNCRTRGELTGREVFYPHHAQDPQAKTYEDYIKFGSDNYPRSVSVGILGSTPLSTILLLPDMAPKDYMHLVAGGHMKWLLGIWQHLFTNDVFENGSEFLSSITLPSSFKYQFLPLEQFPTWKTKLLRDFLLYVAPVFAILFLPDQYVEHFLLYFLYVKALHFFTDRQQLVDIGFLFDKYYSTIDDLYGHRASLCSLHMHTHLLKQVYQHGALAFTSCFPRESYLAYAIKLCHGSRNILQQFVNRCDINQRITPKNALSLDDVFIKETIYDSTYVHHQFIHDIERECLASIAVQNISLPDSIDKIAHVRFSRGLSKFTSRAYSRTRRAKNFQVAIQNMKCRHQSKMCFAEVLFYVIIDAVNYAFVKAHACTSRSITADLHCSKLVRERMEELYRFYDSTRFFLKLIPVSHILHKVICFPVLEHDVFCFTCVYLDYEHD